VFLRQIGAAGNIFLEFVEDDNDHTSNLAEFEDFQLFHRLWAAIGLGDYQTRLSDHQAFESRLSDVMEPAIHRPLNPLIVSTLRSDTALCF